MQRLLSRPIALTKRRRIAFKCFLHVLLFGYVLSLFGLASVDALGADPVESLLDETGIKAVWLLLFTLLIPLISQSVPFPYLMQCRRLIGLYAFFYVCCHFTTFYLFELQADLALIWDEIIERPYITVGAGSLTILTLLAVTSFTRIRRAMGTRWQILHRFVYLAVVLALLHFTWAQKTGWQEPIWYWLIAVLIISIRFIFKPTWSSKRA